MERIKLGYGEVQKEGPNYVVFFPHAIIYGWMGELRIPFAALVSANDCLEEIRKLEGK